ncbi:MAG: hypothetical protein GX557_15240 [Chloroflexi bacterium]|nr:hypothetical protein [Chloroflexota bacterium]
MLPKERVIAALEFAHPDRIPVGETGIDYTITEQILGHPTLYRGKWKEHTALWEGRRDAYVESCKRDIVALALALEHDIVPAFLVPPRNLKPATPEFVGPYTWRNPDGRVYAYSPITEGHPFILANPDQALEEIADLRFEPDDSEFELVEHIVREVGGTHFILGRPGDDVLPISRYTIEYLMLTLMDRPDVFQRIVEVETRYCIAVSEALLDAGCDAVLPTSDVADNKGPLLSPRMFREHLFPWLKRLGDAVHARGKYLIKHTDGNMWPLLDMLIEAGVDGWQGIQPAIGMTLPALQERYGGRLCFWGGVDNDTLVAGTPDEVTAQVRVACESAPSAGGLVLTCGNSVMVGTRLDNYLAMRQALRTYGAA